MSTTLGNTLKGSAHTLGVMNLSNHLQLSVMAKETSQKNEIT
jgi:hypothetical protein